MEQNNYLEIRGPRGLAMYIHHHFVFIREFARNGVIFLKCIKRFCHARGRIHQDSNLSIFPDDSVHSHAPPRDLVQLM
jgi:hypothetical protein